jgi:GNAT superfamily N-acetyltransferase
MTVIPAGTEVRFKITYLHMPERPTYGPGVLPDDVSLIKAEHPPVWFFLAMYDGVGRAYEWQDRFEQAKTDPEALAGFVGHPDVTMWVAYRSGWPHGFFMLDHSEPGVCDLAYFGLVPEAVGHGWGRALLQTAIFKGWSDPRTEKMTVNTCELDHPRALGLYQRMGFTPIHTEHRTRVLVYDRDPSQFP